MTSRYLSASSSRQHAPAARMLSFALLLLIAYGATVGAAHRHGQALAQERADAAATMQGASDSGSTARETGTGGECLMCRLHQHLFAGLLHHVPAFVPPSVQLTREALASVSYFSQANAPSRGRAPPALSIL